MELKVFILSVACISLLTPTAMGSVILAKAAAASAIKGATLIGTGLAMEGTAAALATKGLAIAALKGIAFKGALLAKGLLLGKAALLGAAGTGSTMLPQPVPSAPALECNPCGVTINQPVIEQKVPTLIDIISGIWSNVQKKTEIVSGAIEGLREKEKEIVRPPKLYEIITRPRVSYYPQYAYEEVDCVKK